MSVVVKRNTLLFSLLLLPYFTSLIHGQFVDFMDDPPQTVKDPATVTKNWQKLEDLAKQAVSEGMKTMMPLLMENMQNFNISSSCVKDTVRVIGGIRRLETWALKLLDSSGKGMDGVFTGTVSSFGDYDQCLDTVALNQRAGKQKGKVMFSGKYCLVRINPTLPPENISFTANDILDELKVINEKQTALGEAAKYGSLLYYFSARLGICIPSGCSVDDLSQILRAANNYTGLYMRVGRCKVKEETKFTTLIICVIFVYSFVGLIVFIGTLVDFYSHYYGKKMNSMSARILLAFSFLSNFKKLVDTSSSSDTMGCLNGIRFLTMSWVILFHTYILTPMHISAGLLKVRMMAQEFEMQTIMNGTLSVNSFFVLGGLLMTYHVVKRAKRNNGQFSVKMHIIRRLWRILPMYIFVILFVFVGEIIPSGPVADDILQPFVGGCKKNWWANLLFINNYYDTNESCLVYTWYLAVDMQFYIVSLIIILPLLRYPKVGLTIAAAFTAASIISSSLITYLNDLPPAILPWSPSIRFAMMRVLGTRLYIVPYQHLSSYTIGIMAGYLLAVNPKIRIPKVILAFGWCFSIAVSIAALYGTYGWNGGKEQTFWETIIFAGFHRFAWSLGLAWMIVCCATGHGGVINYILSWKIWTVLGRLCFTAYLIHMLIIIFYNASATMLVQPKHVTFVWIFFGHMLVTIAVAFAGNMLIEAPFATLEKLVFPDHRQTQHNTAEKHENSCSDSAETMDAEILNNKCKIAQLSNGKTHDSHENCNVLSIKL